MPYKINSDNNEKIIIVKVFGKAKIEEHHDAFENALQLCIKNKINKLLVDLRDVDTKGIVTTAGAFNFGKMLSSDNRMKGIYLTHVLPVLPKSNKDIEFISIVALNRGAIIKNFTSIKEAREWLVSHK